MHFRKLDQYGFDHVIGIVFFIVMFAIVGTALLVYSHAQSWSGELQLGFDRSLCLDNRGGSRASGNTIDQYNCNGGTAQKWSINEMNGYTDRFTLEDDQGTCADDWGDKVSSSSGNVALKTYACNSSNKAEQWEWEGSTLENVTSHGCINDPGDSKTSGTALIVYNCTGKPSNELWYEAAQGANTTVQTTASTTTTSTSTSTTSSPTITSFTDISRGLNVGAAYPYTYLVSWTSENAIGCSVEVIGGSPFYTSANRVLDASGSTISDGASGSFSITLQQDTPYRLVLSCRNQAGTSTSASRTIITPKS